MKKTLFAPALAAITLTASAQSEVVTPTGKFDFITKNLTVDNSIIPYSVVGTNYNDEEAKFTIYDTSFNTVRNFTVAMPTLEYEYNIITQEAKVPITKEIQEKWDTGNTYAIIDSEGKPFTINNIDEWKEYVAKRFGEDKVVFTDADGNFAFHENIRDWSPRIEEFYQYQENIFCARKENIFCYYDKESNVIKACEAVVNYLINTESLNWEIVSTEKQKGYKTAEIAETNLFDYDSNCARSYHPYLTQSLFNKDDKFELVVKAYRLGDGGNDDISVGPAYPSRPESITEDYATFRKTSNDGPNIESYLSIINEDGKEIAALPGRSSDFEMLKVDDKVYLSVEVYKDGQYQTIIYSVDNVSTSLTELARTSPVAAKKFFNTQGMQVNKDTKGIVIQKGGVKFLNK